MRSPSLKSFCRRLQEIGGDQSAAIILVSILKSPFYLSIEGEILTVLRQFPAAAVTELTGLLNDPQPAIRAVAAKGLGSLQKQAIAAVPSLLQRLQDDKDVQTAVIEALSEIRDGSDSVRDGLRSHLKGVEAQVRIAAARCLVDLGIDDGSAMEVLAAELKSKIDGHRRTAALAIRRLEGRAEPMISSLIAALCDVDDDVRQTVTEALGQIGSKEAVPALIAMLYDSSDFVASAAAKSLGQCPDAELAVPELIKVCASEHHFIRNSAAEALGRIESRPEACVPVLIGMLSDESDFVLLAVTNALAAFKNQDSTPELLKVLRSNRSETARFSAAFALGDVSKSDETVQELIQTLNDRSNIMRRFAALALGKIGKDAASAQEALINALSKEQDSARIEIAGAIILTGGDPNVPLEVLSSVLRDSTNLRERYWAFGQIVKIGDAAEPLMPDLISALESDNSDDRGSSAQALGAIGMETEEVVSALEVLLEDEAQENRVHAAEALWRINRHPKSLPTLQIALQDRDEWAAVFAALALGKIGPDAITAVPTLQAALREQNFRVRYAIRKALPKITGKPLTEVKSPGVVRPQ